MKKACALALSTLGLLTALQTAHADFMVKVAYADSLRPNGFFPNPWDGSPNTIFWGQIANTGEYDAGAIMIMNTGTTPLVLSSATVDGFTNGASFSIWNGTIGAGYSIPAGQSLILTQNDGTENFDTSDQGPGSAPGDATTPHVKLTLDGIFYNLVDTGQVLNTNGFDIASTGENESFAWRKIGTFGGRAGDVPEPGTVALLGAVGMSGLALVRRRNRR